MSNSPICIGCGKTPKELAEYRDAARNDYPRTTPDNYVRREEGTYNPDTNQFACTECYDRMGCPSAPGRRGWVAGDPIRGTIDEMHGVAK